MRRIDQQADRQDCYLHSTRAILDGQGLLFVGYSAAGKSTLSMMLRDEMELLCDDRNIVRYHPDGFRVYGTWSHGEWPVVSASSEPLRTILFLQQASENRIIPLDDRKAIIHRLLACVIKPLETVDWSFYGCCVSDEAHPFISWLYPTL